jgi:murein L,D-transpeptidase YcbB/YkuD
MLRSIAGAVLLSFVCPVLAQTLPAPAQPPAPPPVDGPSTVRYLVDTSKMDELRWPDFSDYRKHLLNFYQPLNWQFAWTRNGRVTPQARAVITLFEHADGKGINAADYDGSRWDARLRSVERRGVTDIELGRFDVAVSISLMRYISDLHIGRINPRNLRFDLDIESKKYYLPKLLTDIKDSPDPGAILAQVEPPYPEYRRLQAALGKYRRIAAEAASEAPLPEKTTVNAGEAYAQAPLLARMLQRVGDLPANARIDTKHLVYDGAVVEAVKKFQARHGLEPTGTLGPKTLHQLNPLGFRVRQIQWALERWRWAPMQFDTPPIIVNIPEFVLHGWDDAAKPAIEMRVVVGRAYNHQTPVFAAEMKYLVLRPFWNVPPSIQTKELVPKASKSATYLARNGYELVTPDGEIVDAGSVDEATLAKLRSGELQIRQKPGPNNALGLVKFMFPNQNNIYLHSTPSQELFARSRRDFSHGCIRVEYPVKLAAWVLRDQPDWTPERIAKAMKGGEPTQVNLKKAIPIMLIYTTASVDQNGQVRFFDDIYGHDMTLENALAAGYPYPA